MLVVRPPIVGANPSYPDIRIDIAIFKTAACPLVKQTGLSVNGLKIDIIVSNSGWLVGFDMDKRHQTTLFATLDSLVSRP